MTPREVEIERTYRAAMRRCDRMEWAGLAMTIVGLLIVAISLEAMR